MDAEFYHGVLNSLGDGIYFVDLEHRVTIWNKAAERLSGFAAREVLGRQSADILQHVDIDGLLCVPGDPLSAAMKDGIVREAEVYLHHKYGYRFPVVVRASPVRGSDGAIIGAVEVFSSNRKALNVLKELEALRKETLTDPLTGIGNRRFADITCKPLEASFSEHGVPFGILFVDIDNFKEVNDTWGHNIGDLVLGMVAQTLANSLRTVDVACRWGGEEFVLLVPITNEKTLLAMGERQRLLVENSWLDQEGQRIAVTASFGGAVSRKGETAADVLDRADKQVYKSKESGRNRVKVDMEP